MLQIPLAAVPSQNVRATLGLQDCSLTISQKGDSIYMDIDLEEVRILSGAICRDRVRIVRSAYLGLKGDLAFVDTMGKEDPDYTGLGSRWVLLYLEPAVSE